MNSTHIPPSMRAILGSLLIGILAITANVGLFVVLLFAGANSGLGFFKNIQALYHQYPTLSLAILSFEFGLLFIWPIAFCYFVFKHDKQLIKLIKQMIVGWCVLLAFIAIVTTLILLAIYHDGRIGTVATFIVGMLTSPFTMELILCFIGVMLIIALNTIRAKLQGDEYVELEIPD